MSRTLVLASILLLGTFAAQAGSRPSAPLSTNARLADASTRSDDSAQDKHDKQESDKERKERKLRELFVASHQKEIAQVGIEFARTSFKKMGLPDSFIDEFQQQMGVDEILALTAEVYDKNLEEESIDALTAFYRTEQGQKIAEALPAITKESTQKGSELGERIARDIASRGK